MPSAFSLSGLKFGWSCGREAEGGGLLNRYTVVKPYRGFESLRLRHPSPCEAWDNWQDFQKAKDGGAGSVNELLFDKIADRQFWARGEAERSEQSEDGKHALSMFFAIPTAPPCPPSASAGFP